MDPLRKYRHRLHSGPGVAVRLELGQAAQPLAVAAEGGLGRFFCVCDRLRDVARRPRRALPLSLGLLRALQRLQHAADTVSRPPSRRVAASVLASVSTSTPWEYRRAA